MIPKYLLSLLLLNIRYSLPSKAKATKFIGGIVASNKSAWSFAASHFVLSKGGKFLRRRRDSHPRRWPAHQAERPLQREEHVGRRTGQDKFQSWACTQKMQLARPLVQLLRKLLTQYHYIKHLLVHPKSRVVVHLGVQVPSSDKFLAGIQKYSRF